MNIVCEYYVMIIEQYIKIICNNLYLLNTSRDKVVTKGRFNMGCPSSYTRVRNINCPSTCNSLLRWPRCERQSLSLIQLECESSGSFTSRLGTCQHNFLYLRPCLLTEPPHHPEHTLHIDRYVTEIWWII